MHTKKIIQRRFHTHKSTHIHIHIHIHIHRQRQRQRQRQRHRHLFLALTARFVGRDALTAGGGDVASLSDSDDKGGAAGGDERSRSPYSMEGAEVH